MRSRATRKPVLSMKQANDLMKIIKDVAVSAGEFIASKPETKEREQKRAAYHEALDTAEDYIRSLAESAPPKIVPPEAAP